jgi:20S proteasome alpha/beta subunit
MTLVAAFRCRNTGILLCADRQEDDGYTKREMDKIFRSGFYQFEFFMAGAGLITVIKDAWAEINRDLHNATNFDKRDILVEHRPIIEASLKAIHIKHKGEDLSRFPLGLLIVIAPRKQNSIPILYRTDKSTLIEESTYAAYGSGQTLSDYFAGYLYKHGLPDDHLAVLASFIFREAEKYASGVGLGSDMVFICPNSLLKFLGKESIAEIQAGIPDLKESIYSHWAEHLKVPAWLRDYAASSGLTE